MGPSPPTGPQQPGFVPRIQSDSPAEAVIFVSGAASPAVAAGAGPASTSRGMGEKGACPRAAPIPTTVRTRAHGQTLFQLMPSSPFQGRVIRCRTTTIDLRKADPSNLRTGRAVRLTTMPKKATPTGMPVVGIGEVLLLRQNTGDGDFRLPGRSAVLSTAC